MEKYDIKAINLVSKDSNLITIIEDEDKEGNIVLSTVIDNKEYCSCNESYFESFKELKDKLLKLGYGLQCVGAKSNAIQSPMASASDKVYLVELGQQARGILSLYDYSNNEEYPNMEEQNEFFDKWIKSFK